VTLALCGRHLANGERPRVDLLLDVPELLLPALGFSLANGLRCGQVWLLSNPICTRTADRPKPEPTSGDHALVTGEDGPGDYVPKPALAVGPRIPGLRVAST
jgi:hypothetical protein